MKKIFAVILAILMIGALLAACGSKTVKTTVSKTYDDGYAKDFANTAKTDDNGNTTYEFTDEKYDDYIYRHNNVVSQEISKEIVARHGSTFGQFVRLDGEKNAVVIGLNPGEYDASIAAEEAPVLGAKAWPYFQSLEKPVSSISVLYVNANNQDEVYGSFDISL